MKNTKLLLLFLSVLVLTACNKDDDETSCLQSDWVGTYEGTLDCNGFVEDVMVTITASGSENIVIQYETNSNSTQYSSLTPNECSFMHSQTINNDMISSEGSLNGDDLSLMEVIEFSGQTVNCNLTATRQ